MGVRRLPGGGLSSTTPTGFLRTGGGGPPVDATPPISDGDEVAGGQRSIALCSGGRAPARRHPLIAFDSARLGVVDDALLLGFMPGILMAVMATGTRVRLGWK